ncbi:MAG: adenylyltransferase/cytidyltransferase family protein [Bacteroidota bacterium]
MGQVIGRGDVGRLAASLRRQDMKTVLTNGCFDLLHIGHLRYLRAAKAIGDVLLVGVNCDARVRALKGPERPYVPEAERVEMIAGLAPVDYAFIFSEDTAAGLVREIRPDIYAKGGDYREEDIPEAPEVRACGARLVILPLVPGRSTTGLAARVTVSHIGV